VAENFQKHLLLYGWLPKPTVVNYLKNQCTRGEVAREQEVLKQWELATKAFSGKKPLSFELISCAPIEEKYAAKLQSIRQDKRFSHTYQQLPTNFEIIEIDKLIACQSTVALDYIEKLTRTFQKNLDFDALIDICLSLDKTVPEVSDIQANEQTIVYSSENTDFRFLGALQKPLNEIALDTSSTGGIPTRALVLLFGYGGSPVSVTKVAKRYFLNNGFHRIFALRKVGVTHIPAVIQEVLNPALEFPAVYQNIPKEYLLASDRLPMMEDYFNNEMTIELKQKARRRGIKVMWIAEAIDVPL
jgi:hypothetical protein